MRDPQETNTDPKVPARWWIALSGIVLLAAVVRLCNLGTFSLWLDEAFTVARANLPLPELVAAAAADPDNVPLYLIMTHLSMVLGLVEPWIRLVPIAAGLASVVVWAVWTRSHFGDRIGLLTAGFMALSTFHVRYSQELRAYPYLLLITGLAMLAADRLRTRQTLSSALVLAATVAFGWYAHFSFAMTLVPIAGLVLFPDRESPPAATDRRRRAALLAASIALGTLAFAPWLAAVAGALPDRLSRGATVWNLATVGRRWEFLTVAANDSSLLSWLGALLAILAAVGLTAAAGRRIGRMVVIPAAATIVVAELLFHLVNRWSKARYATAAWPFLAILVVLGLDLLLRRLGDRRLRGIAALAVALAMAVRVDAYHREGRPHWDRMAAAIEASRRPTEPLLLESEWIASCLPLYYSGDTQSLRWSIEPIHEALVGSPSVLLVTSTHHADNPALRRLSRRGALVAEIPQTGALVRLRPDMVRSADDPLPWPTAAADLVPDVLEAPLQGCLSRLVPKGRWRAGGSGRIEFDEESRAALRGGFTGPRTGADGTTFAWVDGPEAAAVLERSRPTPARLAMSVRPFRGISHQELRAVVNGQPVGAATLNPGPQTISFDTPATCWRRGRNLVVLQFRVVVLRDGFEARAAAIDWLEVTPLVDPQAGRSQ